MSDGRIKVLDFGIAKALSMSRKVTRNDFGSLAYLSPERIESGGEMDATDGFWALGVMLYEMVAARSRSARRHARLERLIVSRRPAPRLDGVCPIGPPGDRRQAARSRRPRTAIRAPRPSAAISSAIRRRGDRRAEAGMAGRRRRTNR
jgi:serine/threonine protein kinase